jgi:tetratricopeptide (TPR) repeat protein
MPQVNAEIEQAVRAAMAHHRAGRLDEAIAAYQHVIDIAPSSAEIHNNLGMALRQRGRFDDAIAQYQLAVQIKPDLAEAFNNMGIALKDKGQFEQAIAAYRQAVALKSDVAGAWHNLGFALTQTKRFDEALEACARAVALDPRLVEAHNNMGIALQGQGRLDEAVAAFGRAIALRDNFVRAHRNLGKALLDLERADEAVAAYERANQLAPQSADVLCDLASALVAADRGSDAVDACRRALAIEPLLPRAHFNLGAALGAMKRYQESLDAYRRAIELQPDYAGAHWNLALALLGLGDYRVGWAEYEWERQVPALPRVKSFDKPQWDGTDLCGRTILLHASQGYGDSIQFIRYVPLVSQRGGRVIVECAKGLRRLFSGLEGVGAETNQIIVEGDPRPDFDVQCQLMGLPHAFGTLVESIPAQVPYLRPDAALARTWAAKMTGINGMRVGLVWATQTKPDRKRSATLQQLSALWEVAGVSFVPLQRSSVREDGTGLVALDLIEQVTDFAETAAVIANLDLVISIDTAVVHVAGAMGKPVWVMVPYLPDWRWLLDREDSPWYPTARLFRQTSPGDWPGVARNVARALLDFRPQ